MVIEFPYNLWVLGYLLYTQVTYNISMKALFIELPPFARYRQDYLADNDYRNLQNFYF
jgi:hypothetical protein